MRNKFSSAQASRAELSLRCLSEKAYSYYSFTSPLTVYEYTCDVPKEDLLEDDDYDVEEFEDDETETCAVTRYAINEGSDRDSMVEGLTLDEVERYFEDGVDDKELCLWRMAQKEEKVTSPNEWCNIFAWITVFKETTADEIKLYDALRMSTCRRIVQHYTIDRADEAYEDIKDEFRYVNIEEKGGLVVVSGYAISEIGKDGLESWELLGADSKYQNMPVGRILRGKTRVVLHNE